MRFLTKALREAKKCIYLCTVTDQMNMSSSIIQSAGNYIYSLKRKKLKHETLILKNAFLEFACMQEDVFTRTEKSRWNFKWTTISICVTVIQILKYWAYLVSEFTKERYEDLKKKVEITFGEPERPDETRF